MLSTMVWYTCGMEFDKLLERLESVLRELEKVMLPEEWALFLDSVYKVLYNGD